MTRVYNPATVEDLRQSNIRAILDKWDDLKFIQFHPSEWGSEADVRPHKNPRKTEPGFAGITACFWNRLLDRADKWARKYREGGVILVEVTARHVWELYLHQKCVCALSGLPLWFNLSSRPGGANWILERFKHEAFWYYNAMTERQDKPWRRAINRNGLETKTASLDRMDTNLGYVRGNLQWIHKDLQAIKGCADDAHFIRWCQLVSFANDI